MCQRGALALSRMNDREARVTVAGSHTLHDAWRAASLLVGLFGNDASNYAAKKLARCLATRDLAGATTWSLIESQIELLLTGRANRHVS